MSGAEIIKPPNALKNAKSGSGPGKLDNELLERAEKAVQKMEVSYNEWVKDDLDEIEMVLKDLIAADGKDNDLIKQLYCVVFDTKGQGGSFGYHLLTQVAGSLADFLNDRKEFNQFGLEVATAHVASMRAVIKENIRDDGGPTGVALVESLQTMVAKARASESDAA